MRIDCKAFVDSMKAASAHIGGLVMKALGRSAEMAATYGKVTTLYRSRTYGLRESIRDGTTGEFSAQTSANAPYARFVEEGTRPHVIAPRRKRALRFEQNGTIRFAKRVQHPGTKPRPFMQRARDRAEPLFDRLCREAIDRMFG